MAIYFFEEEIIAFGAVGVSTQGLEGFAFDNVWIGNRTRNVLLEHFSNKGFQPSSGLTTDDMNQYVYNLYSSSKTAVEGLADSLQQFSCATISESPDSTELQYELDVHHYTLYYYNRRGELVRTVPPQGVDLLDNTAIAALKQYRKDGSGSPSTWLPDHKMVTSYHYDAQGRPQSVQSPDGGETHTVYNTDGMLRFTQDARQREFSPQRYSYVLYDSLYRPTEGGEAQFSGSDFRSALLPYRNDLEYPGTAVTKHEWTKTYYNLPHEIIAGDTASYYAKGLGYRQRYLRNRVSYTETYNGFIDSNHLNISTFSYDVHGNVEWVRQHIVGLGENYMRMDYDLISGKVNKAYYNEFSADAFQHRYEYDEQNRLTAVYTSRDGVIWDRDANYRYYEHGPLQRMELGEDRIQGLDYVYTIQGWIKSVNHPFLERFSPASGGFAKTDNDPGKDGQSGAANAAVAPDVWGFTLGYFEGDYTRNNSLKNALDYSSSLYNGNITQWGAGFNADLLPLPTTWNKDYFTQRRFRYDDLNRIKNSSLRYMANPTDSAISLTNTGEYATAYQYDANGNLQKLVRHGYGNPTDSTYLVDSLIYYYGSGDKQNRLHAVRSTQKVGTTDIMNNPQFFLIIFSLTIGSCLIPPSKSEYISIFSGDYYLKSDTTIKVLTVTDGKYYVFSHPEIGYFTGRVDRYEYSFEFDASTSLYVDSLNCAFRLYREEGLDYKIVNSSRHIDFGDLRDVRHEDGVYLIKR